MSLPNERPPEALDKETGAEERTVLPLAIVERRPPFSMGVRVGIFIAGWLLILVGVAGLVLPGIQGVFTIVAGAALLSLDNELIYRLMRRAFLRWPQLWDRIEGLREKTHDRLHRLFHRDEK